MRLIRHCRRHYKALFGQGGGGADAVGESDDSSSDAIERERESKRRGSKRRPAGILTLGVS